MTIVSKAIVNNVGYRYILALSPTVANSRNKYYTTALVVDSITAAVRAFQGVII